MESQPAQVGIWRTSMRCVGVYAWRSCGSKLRLGSRVCWRGELTSQVPGGRCLRLFFAMILSRIVKLLMRNKFGLWCHLLRMDYLGGFPRTTPTPTFSRESYLRHARSTSVGVAYRVGGSALGDFPRRGPADLLGAISDERQFESTAKCRRFLICFPCPCRRLPPCGASLF